MKKWYVFVNKAEDHGSFILDLDESELAVVDKLLEKQGEPLVAGGGYCGYLWREQNDGFNTREEAYEAALNAI